MIKGLQYSFYLANALKSMNMLKTPFGQYNLKRIPEDKSQTLQAWDAADELLLEHLHHEIDLQDKKIVIVNDAFGALACNLHEFKPISWGDSVISLKAIELNLKESNLTKIHWIDSISSPDTNKNIHILLIKIPKTLALLEHQLATLKPLISEQTIVISAAMGRHIHRSTLQLFEKYIGSTTTSLAQKKARLIFSEVDTNKKGLPSPFPSTYTLTEKNISLTEHANVFSRGKLDIGTRFLLEQYDQLPPATKIIDLGCGNGLLGVLAKRQKPNAEVHFIDESYMAVESARINIETAGLATECSSFFHVNNGIDDTKINQVDLILCNPPFHQQHAIGKQTAQLMFTQSKKALKQGGILWIVGNRHLHYSKSLKHIFGNAKVIASNKKFDIIKCVKR